jgi:acyl-CoA thioester hydrolase
MEKKIYYHDTDCGGVVYYANYLKYFEEARTEFLESRGLSVPALIGQGLFFAVRSCYVDYKRPARYGDVILCDAVVDRMTGAQLFFKQQVRLKSTGVLMAEAEVVLVCLTKDFKPAALSDEMKEKLA